jgi:hypothetical protein
MHVYMLVAVVFAVTAALLAHSKGRSSVGWFLCGLVIGPFAFIVAALPPVVRRGRFSKCPTCGEVVRADANMCRYCRTELEPEGAVSPAGIAEDAVGEPAAWR